MLSVDCNFPGGNIVLDRIEGDTIAVHQDIRDTITDWFYWYFRVNGAAGQTLNVVFTASDVIGARGPAASLDCGLTWRWLGMECVHGQSFTFSVPSNVDEVRFSMGMPYLQANLDSFLQDYQGNPALQQATLCSSPKGRPVELLYLGRRDESAHFHVLLTCRHHCCEMMASYSLEGILATVLGDAEEGQWLRANVAFMVVPFMDKDGVEDGDQGKNRSPHDHNRDYTAAPLYPEVRALMGRVQASFVPLDLYLDLHCPWIRGDTNEYVYLVGEPEPVLWEQQQLFGRMLETHRRGAVPYYTNDNMPFGEAWNTGAEPGLKTAVDWAKTLPGVQLASTIEIAYANANDVEVNASSARSFGEDLARTIAIYLQNLGKGAQKV